MDYSLIGVAVTALTAAKDLGKAAIGIRDFNQVATVVAQLNEQLLKAQDALFSHNAELLTLQQEQFKTAEELRKLKEALAQRGSYSLVDIGNGVFVYRVNVSPESGDVINPGGAEPSHYVCQPCFDKGVKSVLQRDSRYGSVYWGCRVCKSEFFTGETVPYV